MDTILRVAPPMGQTEQKTVTADADWKEVKALQDKGIQVVRKG